MDPLFSTSVTDDLSIAHIHYTVPTEQYAKRVAELALIEQNIPYYAPAYSEVSFRTDFKNPRGFPYGVQSAWVSVQPTTSETDCVKVMDNVFGISYTVRINTLNMLGQINHAHKVYIHAPTLHYAPRCEESPKEMMRQLREQQSHELGVFLAHLYHSNTDRSQA
jgi:hypothetical protein